MYLSMKDIELNIKKLQRKGGDGREVSKFSEQSQQLREF